MKTKNTPQEINFNEEIFPNWQIFIYLAIVNFLIAFMASQFIFTREYYYSIFSDQMELTRIDKYVDIINRFSFWSMALLPLFLLVRYLFVAFIIQIPLLIRYIEISFKYIFRWVMLSSMILTLGQLAHFLIIYLTPVEKISDKLFRIQPLSLASMIDPQNYSSNAIVIFNQFNLFDGLWGLIIYLGLIKTGKIRMREAFLLVLYVWTFLMILQWAILFFLEKIR